MRSATPSGGTAGVLAFVPVRTRITTGTHPRRLAGRSAEARQHLRGAALVRFELDPEDIERIASRAAALLAEEQGGPTVYCARTLAAELGVSERTVRRAISGGELIAYRRLGRYVILPSDVEEWVRSGPRAAVPRRASSPRARPPVSSSPGVNAMFAAARR